MWTALSNGDGTFQPARFALPDFGVNDGWRVDTPRFLADLTGDGRADIVGFGDDGVWTALNNGDGTFQPARFVLPGFGVNDGWRVDMHPRFLADLTGDGRADIVGFGDDGVWTALSNGDGTVGLPIFELRDFGTKSNSNFEEVYRLAPGGSAGPNGEPTFKTFIQVFNPSEDSEAPATNLPPQRLPAGSYVFVVRCKKPPGQQGLNIIAASMAWKAPTGEFMTPRVQGAGIRISKITRTYGFGNPDKVTKYQYTMDIDGEEVSSGSLLESYYVYQAWMTYIQFHGGPTLPTWQYTQKFVRFSQNRSALGTTRGGHVGYRKVTVVNGTSGENGRSVYTFTSPIDFPDFVDPEIPFAPATSRDYARGLLRELAEYRSGASVPVHHITNKYAFVQRSTWGLKVGWNIPGVGPTGPSFLDRYAVKGYNNLVGYARLIERDERLNEEPDTFVTHAVYEYEEAGHKQLVKETITSSADVIITEYRYPSNYPLGTSAGIDELHQQHAAGVVVETARYRSDGLILLAQRNRYGLFDGIVHQTDVEVAAISNEVLLTASVFDAVEPLYEVRFTYHAYDSFGNVLEASQPGGMVTCFVWDASGTQLIAIVYNARRRQIVYNGFENDLIGTVAGSAYMGLRSKFVDGRYTIASSELPQETGDYLLSYWRQASGTADWIKAEIIIRNYIPGTPIATDLINGFLDEVRVHPLDAVMITFAYTPLIGLQGSADANGFATYFAYDAFGRLATVRDHNGHIRKHHEYVFGREPGGKTGHPSYVRTYKALVAGIETADDLILADLREVQQTTVYLDLMARPIETVQRRWSPKGNDLVRISAYDQFDREGTIFLPFTTETTDGEYKDIGSLHVSLMQFYAGLYADVPTTTAPYARTLYDTSPLNRIVERGAPGEAWQPNATSDSHTKRFAYRANSESDVVLDWRVNNGEVRADRVYPAGTLRVEVSIDEHNGRVGSFYDSEGRKILQSAETFTGEQTRTYFVYDHKGNLVIVIPPRAVDQLLPIPPHPKSPTRIDPETVELECYRYSYDQRNRLVEKGLPGAESQFLVYDRWDRLTMSQDGNQRRTKAWTFYKYDAHDRLVMSGEIIVDGARAKIAEAVDDFYAIAADDARFEVAGNNHGYSDRSFPLLNASARIDRVAYFDDYSFVSALASPSSYAFYPELSVTARLERAVGQPTGSKLRVLSTNHFVSSVTYYDTDYQPVQSISNAPISGWSRQTKKYNFAGNLLRSLDTLELAGTSARIEKQRAYDHAQRVQRVLVRLDDNDAVVLSSLHYNEVGKLVCKKLHSDSAGETFAQGVDYRYNIRGWLTSIDAASLEQPESQKLFAMDVFYEQELQEFSSVPQFNGNVSAVRWRNAHINEEQVYIYSYDGFDRLGAARYRTAGPKDGAFDVCGFGGSSIAYDPNGNLSAVSRYAFVSSQRVEVDRLAYEYRGNQLKRVRDLSGRSEGFHDAGFEGDGYEYDANGNMVCDRNNGLQITYNSLNLIDMVTRQSGEWVRFGFDAVGQKRFRETSGPGSVRLDYFGDYVFENGILRLVRHDEGQIVWDSGDGVWRYQYFIDDYLGNVRIAYEVEAEEAHGGESFHSTIILVEDYYPFGLRIVGNQLEGTGGSAVKYLFGGNEVQDVIGLDWYDFGARMLDPAIGRWFVLDAEAEKSPSVTPYGYTLNNPIRYVDLGGRQPAPGSVHVPQPPSRPPPKEQLSQEKEELWMIFRMAGLYGGARSLAIYYASVGATFGSVTMGLSLIATSAWVGASYSSYKAELRQARASWISRLRAEVLMTGVAIGRETALSQPTTTDFSRPLNARGSQLWKAMFDRWHTFLTEYLEAGTRPGSRGFEMTERDVWNSERQRTENLTDEKALQYRLNWAVQQITDEAQYILRDPENRIESATPVAPKTDPGPTSTFEVRPMQYDVLTSSAE